MLGEGCAVSLKTDLTGDDGNSLDGRGDAWLARRARISGSAASAMARVSGSGLSFLDSTLGELGFKEVAGRRGVSTEGSGSCGGPS